MLTAQRRFEPSVIQRLLDKPHRFQFFQAVMMLELWLKQNGVPHEEAVSDFLRFQNTVSLNFPPSEIEALEVSPKLTRQSVEELLEALQTNQLDNIALTPAFIGFLGSNGTLPSHYSERIAAHQLYEKDHGPRAFLDVFSNRSVALFFKAWRKYRLEFKYQVDGKDSFLPLLMSLAGLGHRTLRGRMSEDGAGLLDESIGHFAAAIRHRPPSAAYMQRVLREYFSVPITIEQFVGHWYNVPVDQQTVLGSTNALLGSVAMVGERVWQRDLRMRLKIGPLAKKKFESFLPGGAAAVGLQKILAMFTSVFLEYEIQLILRADQVQSVSLGSDPESGRLGWDTFVTSKPEENDRTDVCYEIHSL
ncbi:type VI secretion system baseplate subunit TssG [Collimonas sp. OK412]|jgi:type VI secretion system protein ImpH|uniref:type VI secretion system baseplate subunit TssG n=1 Tax=Collimonas sp. (strain OK412) TaxID=1801619 RepID=UPI0008E85E1D|nr:type VI secretion system baseplate subunit TssG [Collimonas sp. OK412]SFC32992.1 type VI secretion system protein ImpH [Collimonas sp. OK412]